MASENSTLDNIFNLANKFAVPLVQNLAGEGAQQPQKIANSTSKDTLAEIISWAKLNGSGPADTTTAAQSAPTSIQDFINGTGGTGAVNAAKSGSGMMGIGMVLIIVLGAILIARR